jgi:regulator of protease activity HflC (stomatin/prohibitin superfamily)
METLEADITDQEPHLDEKERLALTEPWKAEQAKKATITKSEGDRQRKINESEGDAQSVINNIIAVKTDQEIGRMLIEYNAWKESAKAGGATFFFGNNGGGSKELDPIVFAKLEEIRKQLAGKSDKPETNEPKPEVKPTGNKKKGGKK